jgi:predicted 2-oxoglutarate/Fe(II)-dependent dioxygenase YbiX
MDSGDIHEVKEITEGTRYALIMWLENKHLKQNSKLI